MQSAQLNRKAHLLIRTSTPKSDLRQLPTEQILHTASNLDQMSALEIARLMNDEDATVAAAIRRALPQVARAIDVVADGLSHGGRLIYVGAGTSGRLGALDASEIPPTFNTSARTVQYIMAGGSRALGSSTEASEDDTALAIKEIKKRKPTKHDIVLGIATSGRTPFTITAVEYASSRGVAHRRSYVQSRLAARTSCRFRHRHRSRTRSHGRLLAHEGRHRTQDGPEHDFNWSHGAAWLRVRQPHGECLDKEREARTARHSHS